MMRLWQVETGITYWVKAHNMVQALAEVQLCEAKSGALDEFNEQDGCEVDELSEYQARKVEYYGDTGDKNMWEAFQSFCGPGVIACSEWP